MTAAAAERLRKTREGVTLNLPVKAVSQVYRGCLVMLLAGVAVAARAATTRAELDTIRVVGLAEDSALGGAADGDVRLDVEKGVFCLANSAAGADLLAVTDIGKLCFVVDDQTVGKTVGGGARPIAGLVVDVDADGVWVDTRFAREPRRVTVPFSISQTDVLAGTAFEIVSPVVGAISSMSTIVQAAVTTGGPVTANVGVTPVAGLSCVVADAAAKGSIVTDTPTMGDATTVVAVGSRLSIVPDAAFATAGALNGLLEITY
jgi:hypothetical protein